MWESKSHAFDHLATRLYLTSLVSFLRTTHTTHQREGWCYWVAIFKGRKWKITFEDKEINFHSWKVEYLLVSCITVHYLHQSPREGWYYDWQAEDCIMMVLRNAILNAVICKQTIFHCTFCKYGNISWFTRPYVILFMHSQGSESTHEFSSKNQASS